MKKIKERDTLVCIKEDNKLHRYPFIYLPGVHPKVDELVVVKGMFNNNGVDYLLLEGYSDNIGYESYNFEKLIDAEEHEEEIKRALEEPAPVMLSVSDGSSRFMEEYE